MCGSEIHTQHNTHTHTHTHTHQALPTSVTELQGIFERADADGNGTLDFEETKQCLIEIGCYSNDDDVKILFEALDTDRSGTLTWEEFMDLSRKAHAVNYVVDYVPLVEILDVKAEIHQNGAEHDQRPKAQIIPSFKRASSLRLVSELQAERDQKKHFFSFKGLQSRLVSQLEAFTGMDIDGDGKADSVVLVPEHDPNESEVHMMITTIEGGHNSGKTYIHRVPEDHAQAWLEALTSAVKVAKAAAARRALEFKYGHSKYSMTRAKAFIIYRSDGFQMITTLVILCAFVVDMCEAQTLPEEGSRMFQTFFALDAVLTVFFALELMVNMFANSNNSFQPFYSKLTNWCVCV